MTAPVVFALQFPIFPVETDGAIADSDAKLHFTGREDSILFPGGVNAVISFDLVSHLDNVSGYLSKA